MKVLFVFLHGIGDCIMFTPAIRMYKERYPDRRLGVLCLPLTEQFWKAHPLIDKVFVSYRNDPLHHGILPLYVFERIKLQRIIKKIRRDFKYDRVEYIVPHSFRVLWMSVPIPGIIRRFLTVPFEGHEILRLCKRLDVGHGGRWPQEFQQELHIPKEYHHDVQRILKNLKGKKPLCIIHATASSKNKSLAMREKDYLIDALKDRYTLCLLQEKAHRPGIKALITNEILISAEVIARATLFVGIDSGPAHIAEVLNIPRIIITKVFKSQLLYLPSNNSLLLDRFDKNAIKNYLEIQGRK